MNSIPLWKILLIDDDEDDYLITREMLAETRGHKTQVTWAGTYDQGRELLLKGDQHFDVVLMDYDLGKSTGIELIREAASLEHVAPIILLTGRGSYEVDLEAMQAGAMLYLTKNEINPLLLERSIRYAIERFQVEQSLRISEERFRALLENSLDVAYRRNLQTERYEYISPVVSQVLGFTPEEMDAMSPQEVLERVHPDDRAQVERELAWSMQTGKARLNYRFLTRSGQYRWLADYITVQTDAEGRPLYRSGIMRDVTERQQITEALRVSETRFRDLADNISQLAWMADTDGQTTWHNRRWYEFTGASLDESRGWGWLGWVHPEEHDRVSAGLRAAIQAGEAWEDTFRLRSRAGRYHWFLSHVEPIRAEQGRVARWFGTLTDISRQVEAERAPRESEERYRLASKAANDAIWDWDLTTDRVHWNEAVFELFGYAEALQGTDSDFWRERIHPDDREEVLAAAQGMIDGEDDTWAQEYRFRRADGSYAEVYDRGLVLRGEQGRPLRLVGAMRDVTLRRR